MHHTRGKTFPQNICGPKTTFQRDFSYVRKVLLQAGFNI